MKTEKGFVALITVLIISAVLLISVVSLGQYGMLARYSLLDLENKTRSESYANACIAIARIAIANDPSYSENDKRITVGDGTCTIKNVTAGVIKATSTVDRANTNYEVTIDTTTNTITSFIERLNF